MIDIAAFTDERGLKIAAQGVKLVIPSALQFTADRLMNSAGRTGTADNDINAIKKYGNDFWWIHCSKSLLNCIRRNSSLKLMFLMVLNISTDHLSKLQWKVTLILVTLDTKLEKDTFLDSLTLEVSLVQTLRNK